MMEKVKSTVSPVYSMENEVFAQLVFYGSILCCKLVFAGFLVTVRRLSNHVYSNPEDCSAYGPKGSDKVKPMFQNESVERARRNHANDIENIPLFLFVALFYVATGPSIVTAVWHFRVFVAARLMHTVAYQLLQIAMIRTVCHVVGVAATVSMLVQIFMAIF